MPGKSSSVADSSLMTISAPMEGTQPPKRRKLDDPSVDRNKISSWIETHTQPLFKTLCAIISHLQTLPKDDSHGYAVEHLKMVLRSSPEQAAEILGRSLNISRHVLQALVDRSAFVYDNFLKELIDPWVEIWKHRSKRIAHDSSNLAFAAKCFVPALEILTILSSLAASKADLKQFHCGLEELLMQHVLVAARNNFKTSSKNPVALDDDGDDDDEGKIIDISDILTPLKGLILSHGYRSLSSAQSTIRNIHPIAQFYRHAIEHTPLGTSKNQNANGPWLQYMFDQILDQIFILPAASRQESQLTQDSSLITKQMLELLVSHSVKLGLGTLDRVLTLFSQILNDSPEQVNWGIVGLCLKIDPDVFVIPESTDRESSSESRNPNKFLAALIARLNGLMEPLQSTSDETIVMVLEDVLVPLAKGFAHARDLLGFINHWRLNLLQNSKSTVGYSQQSITSQSIWEHEDLLQAVAGLTESHLTVGQIETVLQEAKTALDSANMDADASPWTTFAAHTVILDCILSGCRSENTISKLSKTVQEIYKTILGQRRQENSPATPRWRLWRCVATIKNRWDADFKTDTDIHQMEERTATEALNIQTDKDSANDSNERLHSFNYILNVTDNTCSPLREALAESTVQYVLALLNSYAELVMSHLPEASGYLSILTPHSYDISPDKLENLLAIQETTLLYASMLCDRITALR
ncbi:MAG: hypothetical protein Q9209_004415 [Squamulea sp. 1 TL-2023]